MAKLKTRLVRTLWYSSATAECRLCGEMLYVHREIFVELHGAEQGLVCRECSEGSAKEAAARGREYARRMRREAERVEALALLVENMSTKKWNRLPPLADDGEDAVPF
jgi:CRISPR/Cas system-associated protein Csm6